MWFITVIHIDKEGKFSDSRCWGYYVNKQDCIEDLHNNNTDMSEYYYNYAVIENIDEGISMRFARKKYSSCSKVLMMAEPTPCPIISGRI